LTYSAIPPFHERELAGISFPDVDFACRTYHPNHLWRNDIERYFSAIINEISLILKEAQFDFYPYKTL
jgi:hypothetical protein